MLIGGETSIYPGGPGMNTDMPDMSGRDLNAMMGGNMMAPPGISHAGGMYRTMMPQRPQGPGFGSDMANIGMTPLNLKKFKYLQPRTQDPNIPPSCTIYIHNINDRIKLKELKDNLKSMFKQFGEIRQIVAMSSFWRRGQAWVIFADEEAATAAINGMQGFVYHGQPLHINYSINKSDIIAKEDGTFEPRPPGPKKPRAIREREERQRELYIKMQQQYMQLQGISGTGVPGGKTDAASLVASVHSKNAAEPAPSAAPPISNSDSVSNTPHRVLFVENLPDYCTNALLQDAFARSEGMVDIRAILSRKVAFVEYTSEERATRALHQLQGVTISGIPLRLSYARK